MLGNKEHNRDCYDSGVAVSVVEKTISGAFFIFPVGAMSSCLIIVSLCFSCLYRLEDKVLVEE